MWEPTQSQGCRHESQILENGPLLDGSKLIHPGLEVAHRRRAAFHEIVVQVASFRTGEFGEARRLEVIALIHDEGRHIITQGRQQDIDKEATEFGNGEEIGGATDVCRPLIEGGHKGGFARHIQALVSDAYAALLVQFNPSLLACRLHQRGHIQARILLGSLEQPYAIIVDDKDGYHVRSVRTEGSPANKVHDDIAVPGLSNIACVIG